MKIKLDVPKSAKLAVACSGGSDSMALALLGAEWCSVHGSELTVLTVDHGLRPESAEEAKQVRRWLKKRRIKHIVLKWQGKKPTRNIQEAARNARYELMVGYCLANGIHYLLVAHHKEDQAETFLLRLARGSGVDGLAAMQEISSMSGITLLRPLLNVTKAELLSYLKAQKQDHITDPSNQNTDYDRVRMRNAMPMLAELGLTTERLVSTAANMQRARASLEAQAAHVMKNSCQFFPEGYALLHPFSATDEIALRVLASLVMRIGGSIVRPRLEDTERLYVALMQKNFKGVTLGGCQFVPHKGNVLIFREQNAVALPMQAGNGIWDDRFAIECTKRKGWTVGALTQEGWLSLAKKHDLKNPYPDKKILYTLPALRDASGNVRAVPHLGIHEKGVIFKAVLQ